MAYGRKNLIFLISTLTLCQVTLCLKHKEKQAITDGAVNERSVDKQARNYGIHKPLMGFGTENPVGEHNTGPQSNLHAYNNTNWKIFQLLSNILQTKDTLNSGPNTNGILLPNMKRSFFGWRNRNYLMRLGLGKRGVLF